MKTLTQIIEGNLPWSPTLFMDYDTHNTLDTKCVLEIRSAPYYICLLAISIRWAKSLDNRISLIKYHHCGQAISLPPRPLPSYQLKDMVSDSYYCSQMM